MNLMRIVQKRADKRERDNRPVRDVGTILLFVFLLPYVISCLWGHVGEESEVIFGKEKEETACLDRQYDVFLSDGKRTRRMPMQEYLIWKLEQVMPEHNDSGIHYELEALKAQSVLLRTELWLLMIQREEPPQIQDDAASGMAKTGGVSTEETLYGRAVQETDGLYLSYDGYPIKAAFFPVSNGQTREAAEVWADSNYPYLVSVTCGQDIMAKDYQSRVSYTKEEYCRLAGELFAVGSDREDLWGELEFVYDSAGYVTEAGVCEKSCSGEAFRHAFALQSASFQAEWGEAEVVFRVKGVGHGFGMSQYGANEKAAEGASFDQILEAYFFQAELAKIE